MSVFSLKEINERAQNVPLAFIKECEDRYRKTVKDITSDICNEKGRVLVMLAGPSSSGKTTTAELIRAEAENLGRSAKVISLDDFYRDQDVSYTFEDGTVDYETVKALDVECICSCMHSLLDNGYGEIPRFSFITKRREGFEGLEIAEDEIIILEGLHALNPLITDPLCDENMKKLYVSVSSRIADESGILLSKRELRLIRRLIRDYNYRNSEVENTFYLWKGVRMGEDRYLFPYSDRADIKIDSIHPYEVCVFRKEAEKLLDSVAPDSIYYNAAKSLSDKIRRFNYIDTEYIPEKSLLKEFSGK